MEILRVKNLSRTDGPGGAAVKLRNNIALQAGRVVANEDGMAARDEAME